MAFVEKNCVCGSRYSLTGVHRSLPAFNLPVSDETQFLSTWLLIKH